jgi:hypothetical protein
MRKIRLIIAAIFVGGCSGGKKTVPATPEIKAGVAEAQADVFATDQSTYGSLGFRFLAGEIVDAVFNDQVASLDLFSLPNSHGASQEFTSHLGGTGPTGSLLPAPLASGPVTGCIRSDAVSGTPQYVLAGADACTASDHLEITYDSGETMSITHSAGLFFDLHVRVTSGSWAGTDLRYQGSNSFTSTTYAESILMTGVTKYVDAFGSAPFDATFDVKVDLSAFEDPSRDGWNARLGGDVDNRIAGVHALLGWTEAYLRESNPTPTSTKRETSDMTIGSRIDLLRADGATVDHSVAFNVQSHTVDMKIAGPDLFTATATGDIQWDDAWVGTLSLKDLQTYTQWTDGAEEPFDVEALFVAD